MSNIWRSLEIPLVNRRAELKLRWTRYCILSASGNKNNINEDANVNNIIFTIKDTKIYVPVVTLSARDNQKLSKRLSKGFEGSVFWNEYKMKSDNKNTTNELINFLESNFVGVNRLFEFIQIEIIILKDFLLENIIFQKA